jgi:hypothetical protein
VTRFESSDTNDTGTETEIGTKYIQKPKNMKYRNITDTDTCEEQFCETETEDYETTETVESEKEKEKVKKTW